MSRGWISMFGGRAGPIFAVVFVFIGVGGGCSRSV